MIHPDTALIQMEPFGNAVVATRLIPRGTITYARCALDHTVSRDETMRLWPLYGDLLDTYGYVDDQGDTVMCWDHGRFVNHSCDPSTICPGYAFDIAVRDIAPGEQITNDYAVLNIVSGFECLCGAANCRGQVLPDTLLQEADRLDALIAPAFPLLRAVEQPLWPYVREKADVEAALEGRAEIWSCRKHHFPTP